MKIEDPVEKADREDRDCLILAIIFVIIIVVIAYIYEKEVLELYEFLEPWGRCCYK